MNFGYPEENLQEGPDGRWTPEAVWRRPAVSARAPEATCDVLARSTGGDHRPEVARSLCDGGVRDGARQRAKESGMKAALLTENLSKDYGHGRGCSTSTSRWPPARFSATLARTVPARRRRSGC